MDLGALARQETTPRDRWAAMVPNPHPMANCGPLQLALPAGTTCPTCGTLIEAPEAAPTDHRSAASCHPECGAWVVGPEDIVLSVSDTGSLIADLTPERVAGVPPCFIRQSAFPVGAHTAVTKVLSAFNRHHPNRKRPLSTS